jgi:hypothetical protein
VRLLNEISSRRVLHLFLLRLWTRRSRILCACWSLRTSPLFARLAVGGTLVFAGIAGMRLGVVGSLHDLILGFKGLCLCAQKSIPEGELTAAEAAMLRYIPARYRHRSCCPRRSSRHQLTRPFLAYWRGFVERATARGGFRCYCRVSCRS